MNKNDVNSKGIEKRINDPCAVQMFDSYEDLDLFIRLFFILILWPFPLNLQIRLFSLPMLCYIKGQVPVNASGEANVVLLSALDWSLLPIQQLWPHIRDEPAVQALLPFNCADLKLDQILWIAKNDPYHRAILLRNEECTMKIRWNDLEIEDYRQFLTELPVYGISDLNAISENIILEGLIRDKFSFPTPGTLFSFLERIPLHILSNPTLLGHPLALNLFDTNCFVRSEFLIKPLSDLLFNSPSTWTSPRYINVFELYDYLQTFHDDIPQYEIILTKCESIIEGLQFEDFNFLDNESSNILKALHYRDSSYFVSKSDDPDYLKEYCHQFGPFDQYRLLLILLSLPSQSFYFDEFCKYFDAEFFDDWLLRKFLFLDHPEIREFFHSLPPSKLNGASQELLRFLTLKHQQNPDSAAYPSFFLGLLNDKVPVPVLVAQVAELESADDLFDSLDGLFSRHLSSFARNSFCIKYSSDAVVDLGGPLLDWITGILQLYIDFGLFSLSNEIEGAGGDCGKSQVFLDPIYFRFLGLLHGKLIQIGSGPRWMPTITSHILDQITTLAEMHSDHGEAVRLFNEFGFPSLNCAHEELKLLSHSEIELYLMEFETQFAAWKLQAWQQYRIGLDHFIIPHVPDHFVQCLLNPSSPPTAALIAKFSHVVFPPLIPSSTWFMILETLTPEELTKLMIFLTGQCRLVQISVHLSFLLKRRLPHGRTCFRQLFLYLPNEICIDDLESIINFLSDALKTSIYNYQGFGNS